MDQIHSDALGTLLHYCDSLKERIVILEDQVTKLTKKRYDCSHKMNSINI